MSSHDNLNNFQDSLAFVSLHRDRNMSGNTDFNKRKRKPDENYTASTKGSLLMEMFNELQQSLWLSKKHVRKLDKELVKYTVRAEYLRVNEPKLLPAQKLVYKTAVSAVEKQVGGIFFLDAPGGTGKSFVTQLILAKIRHKKQIALAIASSGITATLLPGGRTAHSAFKLPLDLVKAEVSICNIGKNSEEAEVLRQCLLIVWDTMTNKGAPEALDWSLKGIRDSTASMGGATLLLPGDLWQTLPIIPKGSWADEVYACLKSSTLWPKVKTLSLSTNMPPHLLGDSMSAAFAEDILTLGEGKVPRNDSGDISISELCNTVDNPSDLLETVFPNLESNMQTSIGSVKEPTWPPKL
ncbi:uncharacterized protein LOC106883834 [Octopus bimaculoides]|uniref:uncharacterized protein LOC106883834 n=1 Tax=Octopus bimaculoides TaxID=37653 RepID=UPI00071C8C78|nr:uncharacterized protein LOC106883834 [Octopus bimaculoides]|eukprot:XP_014790458.1 PREDICTED: uncharacterized protein LOC106883834 [Octopus bimaculoides]